MGEYMKPSEKWNKPIIGKLTTRKINHLNLRENEEQEYKKASISEETEYEVLEVIKNQDDNLYIVNEWNSELESQGKFIHQQFVKEYKEL